MPKYKQDRALLHISIPMKTRDLLDAELRDPKTNEVAYGAYSRFVTELIHQRFQTAKLDLSRWGFEYDDIIWGSFDTIKKIEMMFNKAVRKDRGEE